MRLRGAIAPPGHLLETGAITDYNPPSPASNVTFAFQYVEAIRDAGAPNSKVLRNLRVIGADLIPPKSVVADQQPPREARIDPMKAL